MRITVEWLTDWFDRFNKLYFGAKLPRPRLAVSRSRTQLGSMSCKRRRIAGRTVFSDYTIRLSNYYEQSERDFQNVLLHEMIHYSISYTGLKDTSAHGVVFRGMMDALNRKYGWNITVSVRNANMNVSQETTTRGQQQCLVLAVRTMSGERLLSVINPQHARRLNSELSRVRQLAEYGWYVSADSYFQRFPKVRSLRFRKVDASVYEEKLAGMTKIDIPSPA